jgi:cytoskeletal protein CcmA (bactofilin family)
MSSVVPNVEITALLGRGTHFEGKLSFEGRVRIDGSFRGEIQTNGVLVIGEGAQVNANIRATSVIVKGGTVEGDIVASESIELYVPARVTGNLKAPEVFMDRGVQFSGECSIDQ